MTMLRSPRRWASESLLRRLWLANTLIVVAVAAGSAIAFYVVGYQEAEEMQDNQLRQIALLVHRWGHVPQSVLAPPGVDIDEDTRVIVERLDGPNSGAALRLPRDLGDGMHSIRSEGGMWRVFVQSGRGGRVAVAQSGDVRLDAAFDGAQGALLPLLSLIPALMWLSVIVVRRALLPVRSLADELDARDENALDRLPVDELPREIRPILASINGLIDRLAFTITRERRFVADAAHELRTPVAALILQAENLANGELPGETLARLRSLQGGLARARDVVEQLLSLARANSGRRLTFDRIDPMPVVLRVIEDLMPLAEQRRIDLGMECHRGKPILADATQLYTLLRNGLDNALHYTPEGGRVDLSVSTESAADGGARVNIDIADTGPGIPPEDLRRAFEPFERLPNASGTSGSGLGLAIMRSIAQNLGGRLDLENRPEGGLRLRYSQPAVPGATPDDESIRDRRRGAL